MLALAVPANTEGRSSFDPLAAAVEGSGQDLLSFFFLFSNPSKVACAGLLKVEDSPGHWLRPFPLLPKVESKVVSNLNYVAATLP